MAYMVKIGEQNEDYNKHYKISSTQIKAKYNRNKV